MLVGATGGATAAKDPNAAMSLSASYSQSNAESRRIPDFTARNQSDAVRSVRTYEWTSFSNRTDRLAQLFEGGDWGTPTVKELPFLATDRLLMENETIYEAPANTTGSQPFFFDVGQTCAALWAESTSIFTWAKHWRTKGWHSTATVYINMGLVRHP